MLSYFRYEILSPSDSSDATVSCHSSESSVDSGNVKPLPGESGGEEGGEGDEESVFDEEGMLYGESEYIVMTVLNLSRYRYSPVLNFSRYNF